ncbi:hypothetical protein IE53DRAFT_387129 [Violaceomyces palustris]|uniref:Uncharacterized protein n=1 Tax=Violaceomyces palustris TaxID=1673888 RepID=A0ACD0NXI6_9BASI|nr:hypothetical protein IE53DRAFT_387129 [Violaceomyces palustris]
MSGSNVNPVLALVSKADSLANAFVSTHAQSIPITKSLEALFSNQQGTPSEDEVERHLSALRDSLNVMEQYVGEMMSMLYQVDVFLSDPSTTLRAGFNPKEALGHVSELFHMYQAELLAKRESLADLTCEEISVHDFVENWSRMDEVQQGKKQEMDDLADLLAGFG